MCALFPLPKDKAGVSMFGFLTPVRNEVTDPLLNPAAAQSFWQALSSHDALAAQQALCKALSDPVPRGKSTLVRLQALLVLDQLSRKLVDALLSSDAGNPDAPSGVSRAWQAAFDVCRSFSRAYGHFLRLMRDNQEFAGQREPQSLVLLRIFRQRQLELLLRPFTDERAPAFSWKEIHDAYKFAEAHELLGEAVPVKHNPEVSAVETRLEREYVHVLMQDLMNGGHFPPHEASWINKCIPRWCLALALKPDEAQGDAYRFVVNPEGDAGLVRSNAEVADSALCLDMTPVLKAINAQIGALREGAERSASGSSLGRGRQLKLLQKVSALCVAERPVIERRAERRRTALTVEVVVGLPQILGRLRNKSEEAIAAAPPLANNEDMTISGFGPASQGSTIAPIEGSTEMQLPAGTALSAQLTMVDESDNGCRLQGPALADNPTIPGALLAFRESGSSGPWTLAVIRRIKKRLAGRRVEIGVEYLGKNPRWIVIVVGDPDSGARAASRPEPRFAGVYLPAVADSPIKTLVLPACGLAAGDQLSVRSRTSLHTVRLKEPFDEQAEFIWVPFEIVDQWVKNEPVSI